MWVYVNVKIRRMRPFSRSNVKSCEYDVILKHHVELLTVCGIFKIDRSTLSQLVLSRKWGGAKISYSNFFSIRIDAYRHVLLIEINLTLQECFKRTCIYFFDDRFSEGSMDNTSRGWPKYTNCRIVKTAHIGTYN